MKRFLWIFAVLVIFPGCSSDEIEQPPFRLVEFMSSFTAMANEYISYTVPSLVPDDCCIIEYANGRVSRVVHKNSVPQPINPDGTLPTLLDWYYEFVYSGNKVTLMIKIDNYDIPYSPQKRELFFDDKGRIVKRIARGDTTDFYYSQNGLLTKSVIQNGGYSVIERNFFFDSNDNLIRITGFIDNATARDIKIFEYFEGYDNAINGFKNLGVIEGAFIRSLSRNNFNVYSFATYDEQNTKIDSMRIYLPVKYGANGDPIYGICPGSNSKN